MDKFEEYIWYLLPSALKKNKTVNQFFLFCMVTGALFDKVKEQMFKLREETMLETCTDCMLEVIGDDYNMTRADGETFFEYRKRLMMKAKIAELAGTEQGILYALQTVASCEYSIYPLYK